MGQEINYLETTKGKYPYIYTLNVIEAVQKKYGSITKWSDMVERDSEPDIEALKFFFLIAINEGIDIENEEKEYGKNYSYRSLWKMRQFYLAIPKLSTQLNWSIIQEILPIKDESKRNYYINSCIEHNFSVRQLREHMKTNAFERLINKNNIKLKYIGNTEENKSDILDMIKDPILITMNKSVDKITEKALKKFILEQIEKTMLELGVGFVIYR